MIAEVEISWKGLDATPDIESRVAARVARLEKISGRLTSCRVAIDAPHQHHRTGNLYEVRIEARGPMAVFVVDRDPGDHFAHKDLHVAVRDAFDAIERQIKRWNQTHGGRPESHVEPLRGRIDSLDPGRDCGQIMMTDGRLVYFHKNAVANHRYAALKSGDMVELSLDPGLDSEHGPNASSVRPVGEEGIAPGKS
jgi:ribosome-associated translation inhibitor RaiA/cold shock CspA family protein